MKAIKLTAGFLLISLNVAAQQGPKGYESCKKKLVLTEPTNIAMGDSGRYKYLFNQIGPVVISAQPFFGGKSAPATKRHAWAQPISEMDVEGTSAILAEGFSKLKAHIEGADTLTGEEINQTSDLIQENISAIGIKKEIIAQAFELSETYEKIIGPLFITDSIMDRKGEVGKEINHAIFYIQDAITRSYCSANLENFPKVYNGAWFKTSEYFPGKVKAPADPNHVDKIRVNASYPTNWGTPIMFHKDNPARRPTGTYVAPGSIVKIKVPASVVNKGYTIRVGAHSWDYRYQPKMRRLDRATIIYPILKEEVVIGSPIGGGIYFEVPEGELAGEITIEITGAVRSPFFSTKISHKTSLEEWKAIQRNHPAPWTDFESDKYMVQVPTAWITKYDDPLSYLTAWDKAMDVINDLLGKPRYHGDHTMYQLVDVDWREDYGTPGYPMINNMYYPYKEYAGIGSHFFLLPPTEHQSFSKPIHELGHSHCPGFFEGEIEAIVNLLAVAVANDGFGVPLDEALSWSGNYYKNMTLDKAAITLMINEKFRNNERLTWDEASYQQRGYGKYIDIARLFGWDVIGRMNKKVSEDYMNGLVIPKTQHPVDDRIMRLSVAADANLTPLIHFWGMPPADYKTLADSISAKGLPASPLIYDAIVHYKTLVPEDSGECFAAIRGIKCPPWLEVLRADFDYCNEQWKAKDAAKAKAQIDMILERYFPDGRPIEN